MLPITCSLSSSPSISSFISSHPSLLLLETQCATMRDLHQLHSHIIKSGLARHPVAVSRLLSFSATAPDLDYASLLFSCAPPERTNFMYNTLIRAHAKSSNPHSAIALFLDMLHSPTPPGRLTFPSLFTAYAQLGLADQGMQLHSLVLKLGFASDTYVRNATLSMYAACGRLAEAYRLFNECASFDIVPFNSMIMGLAKKGLVDESRRLFDTMPSRNVVTWSAMISGYVRNAKNLEALDAFRRMQAEGVEPNEQIMVSLLGACASLGTLDRGEWIHGYIKKKKIETNLIVMAAIINMYCKCGSLEKAAAAFESAPTKGLSTWNAMISGLAMHGHGEDAVRMFSRLESSRFQPDHVSFIGILTACNHSGMVDEARYYFSRMSRVYGIERGIEHYGCLVDVLGRAGLVQEAEDVIGRMHIAPDSIVWGSLLSACRSCGNVEIGERAAAKIIELDPRDAGGYMNLSNGYASCGDFDRAVRVRTAMERKGVRKEPGCSVIEVDGVVSEFVAGGMLHARAGEICRVLEGLDLNMRGEVSGMKLGASFSSIS
ncbi:pentatricopeptide repeat-containing protein-like, chloroplastic [Iris pallida]|uniref:Pentatricopeptide repeat-containing protein-like, chloroplastic n=1 Tax=Iris pallida TaxID=29817 RepID=A0AAX6F5K4_IRIPA|nr:pentatricopeptide repeat-containing protein-like, chloroplastic [Iris pallida]